MRDVKQGVNFYPAVDSEFDRMGDVALFTSVIVDMATGNAITNDGSGAFSEIIATANGHAGDTAGIASTGDTTITLVAGSTLVKGDAFDDGAGNLYYITSVNGDVIGLKQKLVADIADAVTLNHVGNTGLYSVQCNIATLGEYLVTIAHPEFGHIALKYATVANTLDEAVSNANSRFDALDSTLGNIAGGQRLVAIS